MKTVTLCIVCARNKCVTTEMREQKWGHENILVRMSNEIIVNNKQQKNLTRMQINMQLGAQTQAFSNRLSGYLCIFDLFYVVVVVVRLRHGAQKSIAFANDNNNHSRIQFLSFVMQIKLKRNRNRNNNLREWDPNFVFNSRIWISETRKIFTKFRYCLFLFKLTTDFIMCIPI